MGEAQKVEFVVAKEPVVTATVPPSEGADFPWYCSSTYKFRTSIVFTVRFDGRRSPLALML